MSAYGSAGFGGKLVTKTMHQGKPAWHLHVPKLGRLMFTRDPGTAWQSGRDAFATELHAHHWGGDGTFKGYHHLGSGNVQSNFVWGLGQDNVGTTNNKAAPILANSGNPFYMYTGTGTTANTYDVQLVTTDSIGSGSITPTLSAIANLTAGTDFQYQFIGTVAYTGTEAVTEWGLFNTNKQGSQSTSTTNTWNAQGQASATWGTTLGASANAFAGYVIYLSSTTTAAYILSNSTGTAGTVTCAVSPTTAFYLLTSGGGSASTPSSNTSVSIYPMMFDHKQFAAINVVNGDSIQFTYKLRIAAGG